MEFLPISARIDENGHLLRDPLLNDVVLATINFYQRVGFSPPWIGYLVKRDNIVVGSAGYKGAPVNGVVEIAYGTYEPYRKQGIATLICKKLVELALSTDASVVITARTLPQNSFSARVLEKNNFRCTGIVNDPEDGDVFEWVYQKQN